MNHAINTLNRRRRYRRGILLISETRAHGSRSKLQEVVAQLCITDTVIYSVAFSPAPDELIQDLRYGEKNFRSIRLPRRSFLPARQLPTAPRNRAI
jgi:hypothetical protein